MRLARISKAKASRLFTIMAALLTSTLLLGVTGCASKPVPVFERVQTAKKIPPPRVTRAGRESDWRPANHIVARGDTLHAIALTYGYDYREIADLNGIAAPYLIRIGQEIKLPVATPTANASEPAGGAVTAPLKQAGAIEGRALGTAETQNVTKTQPKALKLPYSSDAATQIAQLEQQQDTVDKTAEKVAEKTVPVPPVAKLENSVPKSLSDDNKQAQTGENKPGRSPEAASDDEENLEWVWPSAGKLLQSFGETNSKGIDIGGRAGQPVLAAAPGKVVYSGSNLRGYGNLVILKHNKTYLSAYAHNSQILVKEGQQVTRGQKIAEMGKSDADNVKLHFEIRRLGKPVDPLKYLPDKT